MNPGTNHNTHDLFDPSGKVCWGNADNAGFLTQSHYNSKTQVGVYSTTKQSSDTKLMRDEETQVERAFWISDQATLRGQNNANL